MKADSRSCFFAFVLVALIAAGLAGLLTACAAGSPAPVVERNSSARDAARPAASTAVPVASSQEAKPSDANSEYHEVQKSETLYSIAFQHGLDYRELAQWNGLVDPSVVKVGQRLRLTAPEGAPVVTGLAATDGVVVTPLGGTEAPKSPAPAATTAPQPTAPGPLKTEPKAIKQPYSDKALAQLQNPAAEKAIGEPKSEIKQPSPPATAPPSAPAPPSEDGVDWAWPTRGKPKVLFTEATKGIDIAGTRGQPVAAAASGKVIHVGSNLRGYGKLVIIQHNSMFLSAYAHNSQVTVKEGERIAKGQKIAEMGDTDTDQVKLHFEIRRFGKPVDPLRYLPGEKTS